MSRLAGLLAAALVSACATPLTTPEDDTCLSPGAIQTQALAYKAQAFQPQTDETYGGMASLLASCLGAPDSVIRDGVAYEGLRTLLRGQKLSTDEMRDLKQSLLTSLQGSDEDGYRKPFASLVLSEIVRTNRVEPYFTPAESAEILSAGTTFLTDVTDYRGFDDAEGWRHGVAHGADLLMQLALTPGYSREDHLKILDAIAAKITIDDHAYVQGEGERLTRPLLYIAQTRTLSDADWQSWFQTLVDPAPLASWGDAFSSEAALTRLHNIKYTLFPLLIQTMTHDDTDAIPPLPSLMEAVATLP